MSMLSENMVWIRDPEKNLSRIPDAGPQHWPRQHGPDIQFFEFPCVFYQCSVSYPYSFDTDPDPALLGWIPYRSGVLMTKNWEKITAEKIFFFYQTTIYLSLGSIKYVQVTEEAFSTSSTSKHEISWFFLFLSSWIRILIRIHWPDWIRIQSGFGSGSETLIFVFAEMVPALCSLAGRVWTASGTTAPRFASCSAGVPHTTASPPSFWICDRYLY